MNARSRIFVGATPTPMPGPESLIEKDESLVDRFLSLIADGVPRAQAALGCGFSYDTLYGWVRQGLVPNAREPYASLARRLYETEVELLRGWIRQLSGKDTVVDERGKPVTDTRALEFLLERRFPKAFGRGLHEPADPVEDIGRELALAAEQATQLETGGDGGQLDESRWDVVREWFSARPARLLELARETGLAQAALDEAVTQTGRGETKP